ncbi:MAG: hypothetical protein AAFO70_01965, partial [Pseudomonadota bacterium]
LHLHRHIRHALKADRSYGIQVARLAGLPDAVVDRARTVLEQLEEGARDSGAERLVDDLPLFSVASTPKKAEGSPVDAALRDIHPDGLSPMQALEELYRLKGLLKP